MIVQKLFAVPCVAEHELLMLLVIGLLINEIIDFLRGFIEKSSCNDMADNGNNCFIRDTFDEFIKNERQANEK